MELIKPVRGAALSATVANACAALQVTDAGGTVLYHGNILPVSDAWQELWAELFAGNNERPASFRQGRLTNVLGSIE